MRVNVIMNKVEHGKITMTQAGEITRWMMWATEHEVREKDIYELVIIPNDMGGMTVYISVPGEGQYVWFDGSFIHHTGKELDIVTT